MFVIFLNIYSEHRIIAKVGCGAADIKNHKLWIFFSVIQLGRDTNQYEISRNKDLEPNDYYNKMRINIWEWGVSLSWYI